MRLFDSFTRSTCMRSYWVLFCCLFLLLHAQPDALPTSAEFWWNRSASNSCLPAPMCDDPSESSASNQFWCRLGRNPLARTSEPYRRYAVSRLKQLLERNVVGQQHIIPSIVRDIHHKLEHPDDWMIMHFAGDNGVGKTTAANLISAALAFRCHNSVSAPRRQWGCSIGDELLTISGTNYEGMTVEGFRAKVVGDIVAHARRYPYGVVVVNDLSVLALHHASVLLPLFGRADSFPESPDVQLSKLTVIITTDFGKAGRTREKSLPQLQQMIEEDVRNVFGKLYSGHLRTYPFLPTSLQSAQSVAWLTLQDWACARGLASLRVSEMLLKHILDGCLERLSSENSRAVVMHMQGVISELLLAGEVKEFANAHVRIQSVAAADVDRPRGIAAELVTVTATGHLAEGDL